MGMTEPRTERFLEYPPQKGGLVELKDGRLMGIIRGMLKFYSEDRGMTWSEPEPVLDNGEQIIAESDPVGVLRMQSGAIGVTSYRPVRADELPDRGWATARRLRQQSQRGLFFRKSDDEGETWTPEVLVSAPGIVNWYALNDTMIQLSSGRLLWPSYGSSRAAELHPKPLVEGQERGIGHLWSPENVSPTKFFYSDDEGQTWQASDGDLMLWIDQGYGNLDSMHEPTAAETKDGRVLCLARCAQMRAVQTYSDDDGVHWTLPELSELNSANAPIRVRRIPSTGDLMVVWNQVTAQEHREAWGRCRLSAAISTNGGRTWTNFRNIHVSPGMDESPRVSDPEAPQFVRPGSAIKPYDPIPDNPIGGRLRASYPNFWIFGEEVFIEHDYWYRVDPWGTYRVPDKWKHLTKDRNRRTSTGHLLSSLPRRLHILPLKWFYEEA